MTLFEATVGDQLSFSTYFIWLKTFQSKFGEVGAGVALGSLRSNLNLNPSILTLLTSRIECHSCFTGFRRAGSDPG